MALTVSRELRAPLGAAPAALRVRVAGPLRAELGYIVNVKTIDVVVHELLQTVPANRSFPGGSLVVHLWRHLPAHLPAGARLRQVEMCVSRLVRYSISNRADAMLNLTCQFEFSAAHRLYVPSLSEEENRRELGKCVGWHGHNYVLEVTVAGAPDARTGEVLPLAALQATVKELVVDRFDHTCLNTDVSEFACLNPTVENLATVVWGLLEGKFGPAVLQRVRVYETPRIWADVERGDE
jgi:6-pyruvoyltetrahydropterin/6-carboxytetrahydropterin synthase